VKQHSNIVGDDGGSNQGVEREDEHWNQVESCNETIEAKIEEQNRKDRMRYLDSLEHSDDAQKKKQVPENFGTEKWNRHQNGPMFGRHFRPDTRFRWRDPKTNFQFYFAFQFD